jgi:hypothetical protein
MTSNTTGSKPPDNLTSQERAMPRVNKVTAADITASLKAGFSDFLARPAMSGFFGLFYAVFGILLVWTLVGLGKIWMVVPALVAFPLVAPFAAAGLYEMSRRLQKGESFGWTEILTVMANQRKREMGWMAFVTLFILWVWFYQFRTVLVSVREVDLRCAGRQCRLRREARRIPTGFVRRRVSHGRTERHFRSACFRHGIMTARRETDVPAQASPSCAQGSGRADRSTYTDFCAM